MKFVGVALLSLWLSAVAAKSIAMKEKTDKRRYLRTLQEVAEEEDTGSNNEDLSRPDMDDKPERPYPDGDNKGNWWSWKKPHNKPDYGKPDDYRDKPGYPSRPDGDYGGDYDRPQGGDYFDKDRPDNWWGWKKPNGKPDYGKPDYKPGYPRPDGDFGDYGDGYDRPHYGGGDYSKPDNKWAWKKPQGKPDYEYPDKPDYGKPDYGKPDYGKPDYPRPDGDYGDDYNRPGQKWAWKKPHRKPDYSRPDKPDYYPGKPGYPSRPDGDYDGGYDRPQWGDNDKDRPDSWWSWKKPQGKPDYGKPDYGKPDYGKPDYGKPDYGKPDYGKPDYGKPDYGKPDYGKPDYYPGKPGYPRPDGDYGDDYDKPDHKWGWRKQNGKPDYPDYPSRPDGDYGDGYDRPHGGGDYGKPDNKWVWKKPQDKPDYDKPDYPEKPEEPDFPDKPDFPPRPDGGAGDEIEAPNNGGTDDMPPNNAPSYWNWQKKNPKVAMAGSSSPQKVESSSYPSKAPTITKLR